MKKKKLLILLMIGQVHASHCWVDNRYDFEVPLYDKTAPFVYRGNTYHCEVILPIKDGGWFCQTNEVVTKNGSHVLKFEYHPGNFPGGSFIDNNTYGRFTCG